MLPTRIVFLAFKFIASYRINFPWPFQSDTLGLHENQDAARILCTTGKHIIHVLLKLGKQQV